MPVPSPSFSTICSMQCTFMAQNVLYTIGGFFFVSPFFPSFSTTIRSEHFHPLYHIFINYLKYSRFLTISFQTLGQFSFFFLRSLPFFFSCTLICFSVPHITIFRQHYVIDIYQRRCLFITCKMDVFSFFPEFHNFLHFCFTRSFFSPGQFYLYISFEPDFSSNSNKYIQCFLSISISLWLLVTSACQLHRGFLLSHSHF